MKWLDSYGSEKVGDVGFLIETQDFNHGNVTRWSFSDRPPYTNQSHEPRLRGWCGETNNRSVYGRGLVKVVRVAANGRVKVAALPKEEVPVALERLGYPELGED